MHIPNITEIKNKTNSSAGKFGQAFKAAATSEAAKASAVVLGGSVLLGVGYAVFAKTANSVYSAMS